MINNNNSEEKTDDDNQCDTPISEKVQKIQLMN